MYKGVLFKFCSLLMAGTISFNNVQNYRHNAFLNETQKVFETSKFIIRNINISVKKGDYIIKTLNNESISSKVYYNGKKYSILDGDYVLQIYNNETKMYDYCVMYLNEEPIKGNPILIGTSQGFENTSFETSFTIEENYTLFDEVVFTEFAGVEVSGNEFEFAIKQSIGASMVKGTADCIGFAFSYDAIKLTDNNQLLSYYAYLTPYSYNFVLLCYSSYINRYTNSKQYKMVGYDLLYDYAIKNVEIIRG